MELGNTNSGEGTPDFEAGSESSQSDVGPSATSGPPDIYQYDDCGIFLRDLFAHRKRLDTKYSCRKFAESAGFTNPGFLNDVIKGRRKLSADATEKIIKAFELSPIEGEFFRLLVQYSRLKDEDKREEIYRQVQFRRNRSKFTRLNPSLVKYYQDYHYPLVRLAIEICDFKGDYDKLAQVLDPPIPPSAAKKYVRDLCEWGLVKQDQEGHYSVTSKMVEPPQTLLHLVREINREWIRHAFGAIRKFPPEKRHISTMTVALSEKTHRLVLEKIEQFREEILKLAEEETQPQRIMQLSLQYFPRSLTRE